MASSKANARSSVAGASGLVALVQMGVLEIHPWGCRTDKPERPDRIIFDLDPGEGLSFIDVIAAAKEVRTAQLAGSKPPVPGGVNQDPQ